MKKRLFAFLLVLMLIQSAFPALASAEDAAVVKDTEGPKTVLSVYVQAGLYGSKTLAASYTAEKLTALSETKADGYGYQYYKGDAWQAVAATKYVTLSALFSDAGVYFIGGDCLTFTCTDGAYTKAIPTYDEISLNKYYIDSNGSSEVPAAIALNWGNGALEDGSVADIAAKSTETGNLRFVSGISEEQYKTATAAGSRMPSGLVSITVVTKPALTVYTQRGVSGTAAPVKSYSAEELAAMSAINANGYGYLYYKGDAWQAVVATEYVTLDSLFMDAGVRFVSGDTLSFTCTDGVYTKSQPAYADLASAKYYVDASGTSDVPAALASTWGYGAIADGSIADIAKTAMNTGNIRLVSGITEEQYKTMTAAGSRMPSGVVGVTVVSKAYTDVGENNWYYGSVYYCADTGIFEGNADGSFLPEKKMTMAELVTILYRAAGNITDNSGEHWYSKQLDWADMLGVIKAADFNENTEVTRAQFIAMLYNVIKLSGKYNTSVTDEMRTALKTATDYNLLDGSFTDVMAWAVGTGLIKGTGDKTLTLNPGSAVKRDEVCTMLMRYYTGLTAK